MLSGLIVINFYIKNKNRKGITMQNCPVCGYPLENGTTVCPMCGKDLSDVQNKQQESQPLYQPQSHTTNFNSNMPYNELNTKATETLKRFDAKVKKKKPLIVKIIIAFLVFQFAMPILMAIIGLVTFFIFSSQLEENISRLENANVDTVYIEEYQADEPDVLIHKSGKYQMWISQDNNVIKSEFAENAYTDYNEFEGCFYINIDGLETSTSKFNINHYYLDYEDFDVQIVVHGYEEGYESELDIIDTKSDIEEDLSNIRRLDNVEIDNMIFKSYEVDDMIYMIYDAGEGNFIEYTVYTDGFNNDIEDVFKLLSIKIY